MWNLAICDDEKNIAREIYEQIVSLNLDQIHKVKIFTNGLNMVEEVCYGKEAAHIIILDIELGKYNGINLAEQLLQKKPECQIIFISGYDAYYEDVYDVAHVYFIQKPSNSEKLKKALLKSIERLSSLKEESFCVSNKFGNYIIPYDEIYSFEKCRRKIIIKTMSEEEYWVYARFEDIEFQLPDRFIRCHHSYMVNLTKIKALEQDTFLLRNGRRIPISRTYMQRAKSQFIKFIDKEYSQIQ